MNEKTGYPLCWPDGRPRTLAYQRTHARFKTSFAQARENLINEIRRLGGSDLIISSDIPRRNDGLPFSNATPKSGDSGIACYFNRKGKQLCFACDRYLSVDDNMHAISLTIAALRGIARWGTGDMMESAFRGYTAIPERTGGSSWWDVLGVPINATKDQAREAYRSLVKQHHPDQGGSPEMFRQINEAWKQCEAI